MSPVSVRRLLVVLLVATAGAARAAAPPPVPPAEWLLGQVRALSAPETEGRASGTPGAERAARHIAAAFQAAGLRPGGDGGTYFQSFPVPTGIRLGARNALAIVAPARRELALGRDFTPLAVSADGVVEGEVVFAGYGITAPDLGWDDYAGLDVKARVVVVLSGEPRRRDPTSPFRRPDAYHYSERAHKIINAREHGAQAIVLLPPPDGDDALPALRGLAQAWSVVAVFATRAVGEALLAPSGRRLADVAELIDRTLAPQSFPLPGVRVRAAVSLVRERGTAANVVGVLPGTDPRLAGEAVVIGAHYDHLGRGGEGSLAPEQAGAVHPGADDNASGTAAVLGLARAFADAGGTPRTLVFVAFAGEELGLLGSSHYVGHPTVPMERTVLMVNLDMVGRLRGRTLYVGGVDSGTGLRALVQAAGAGEGLRLMLHADPFAPSDHTAFAGARRPVLFLFTGAHADYHRPSDTWEKIDAPGLRAVAAFAARVVAAVAAQPAAPTWVEVKMPPAPAGGRARGYGPLFGVVPAFGDAAGAGVKIGGMRPGSPAEQAGVRPGDVLVRFAGVRVATLQDFVFALRGRRAGDRVEVTVLRDGVEHHLEAVLQERR